MKELFMSIDSEGKVVAKGFAGFSGEHLASSIVVTFNCDAPDAQYFRMYFETSDGTNVFSQQLYHENGKITYELPFDVTTMAHTVYWQLCGYSMVDEQCSLIYKSEIVPIIFGGSISDEGDLATDELVSSLENKLNLVEGFLDGFNILPGSVDYVDSTDSAEVSVTRTDDFQYTFDFSLPKCMDVIKVSTTITTDSWDDSLKTELFYNPYVTRNSFVILNPDFSCIEEFNSCNVAVASQRSGALSFGCTSLPTETISLDMIIFNC